MLKRMRIRYIEVKMLHISLNNHLWHWIDLWYVLTGRI